MDAYLDKIEDKKCRRTRGDGVKVKLMTVSKHCVILVLMFLPGLTNEIILGDKMRKMRHFSIPACIERDQHSLVWVYD